MTNAFGGRDRTDRPVIRRLPQQPFPTRAIALLAVVALLAGACASSGVAAGGASADPSAAAPSPGTSEPAASPAPSPTPTSTPTSTPTPAQAATVGHDPRKFGFAAKGMSGEMMAFVTIGQIRYALEKMDWDVISTVAWFSLEAGSSGAIRNDAGWRAWNSDRMTKLIEMAHAHATKVVISLKRFAWSAGQRAITRQLLASAAARDRLAREVAAEVVRRGVDGVNVDFEPIPVGQKANFTRFVRALRAALDRQAAGYQLTFDITGHHGSYDVGALVGPDAADAVYLMGYHYAGTWTTIAGSTAPMGGPRYDVVDTVRSLLRVVNRNELIVGVPYYGHAWPTATGRLNARTIGGGFDVLYEDAERFAARHVVRYDPVQQVAWIPYRARRCSSCPTTWYQMYFDNARSVAAKWAWIKRQKLLGGGVWTIGFEGRAGALDREMRKAFLVPTP